MPSHATILAAWMALTTLTLSASGQGTPDEPPDPIEDTGEAAESESSSFWDRVDFVVTGGATGNPAAGVRSDAGDLATLRFQTEVAIDFHATEHTTLSFATDHTTSFYRFEGLDGAFGTVGPGEPDRNDPMGHGASNGLTLGIGQDLEVGKTLDRHLRLGAAIRLGNEREEDRCPDDSYSYRAVTTALYRVNDTLTLGLGVGVLSRLERDPWLIAFPVGAWQIADRTRLEFGPTPSLTAYRATLTHAFGDEWIAGAFAGVEYHQFRLDDDNAAATDGILTDLAVPVGIFASYIPLPGLELRGEIGTWAYRRLELRAADGGRLGDLELGQGLMLGASVSYSF